MAATGDRDKKEKSGEGAENCPKEKLPGRTGLPGGDSILAEKEFESPSGKKYRILKTDEQDEYEETPENRPIRDKENDKSSPGKSITKT